MSRRERSESQLKFLTAGSDTNLSAFKYKSIDGYLSSPADKTGINQDSGTSVLRKQWKGLVKRLPIQISAENGLGGERRLTSTNCLRNNARRDMSQRAVTVAGETTVWTNGLKRRALSAYSDSTRGGGRERAGLGVFIFTLAERLNARVYDFKTLRYLCQDMDEDFILLMKFLCINFHVAAIKMFWIQTR
ncbi:hypothetical protein ACJJTC_006467 [Scirpophaga incertulas]